MMGYGYENEQGDRISALIDMINGGGAGRSGDTFEGGGILSLLANAVAQPYGSVRERPGHSPMGAERPMDVRPLAPRTPGEVARDTILAVEDPVAEPGDLERREITTSVLDASGEETGRPFTEADFDALALAPPQLAQMFAGVPVGAPLTPREEMILNALRASASFDPAVNPRRGAIRGRFTAEDMQLLSNFPDEDFSVRLGGPLAALRDLGVGDPVTAPQLRALERARMMP